MLRRIGFSIENSYKNVNVYVYLILYSILSLFLRNVNKFFMSWDFVNKCCYGLMDYRIRKSAIENRIKNSEYIISELIFSSVNQTSYLSMRLIYIKNSKKIQKKIYFLVLY